MKKKIALNMGTSFLLEVVSLVCAFILPRLIMVNYGSEYNGIVSSVSQFLSFITLLRGGIGGVTRAALYRPLQLHDYYKISGILKATERFMRNVTYIFVAFLILFAVLYPLIIDEQFGWFFTFSLVLILGISTITQYYFGITYQMLLQADQKQYVYSVLQMLATIINTVISVLLIRAGMEFRLVKLASAFVFGAIPIIIYFYVHRHYQIDKKVQSDDSAIKQRWDAFAHQVAAFAHSNTDLVILTVFADLYQVSIYTVYFMIANGVKKFVNICSNGIDAAIGNLIARKADDTLKTGVDLYNTLVNLVSTIAFTCTAMLIVPFVMVYTKGVTDTDYYQPLFGYLLCISQFVAIVRLPYQNVVEAAGHFKETRNGAIAEALINIIVTVPLVIKFGCVGAVIGTISSMVFRTVQYAEYASRVILNRSVLDFVKRMVVSFVNVVLLMIPYFVLGMDGYLMRIESYIQWVVYAIIVFLTVTIVSIVVNFLFYFKNMELLVKNVLKMI